MLVNVNVRDQWVALISCMVVRGNAASCIHYNLQEPQDYYSRKISETLQVSLEAVSSNKCFSVERTYVMRPTVRFGSAAKAIDLLECLLLAGSEPNCTKICA